MHTYRRNSPEAAARIVALALIADGHVCQSELDALRAAHVEDALDLPPGCFSSVMRTLCEDLLLPAYASGSSMCSVDETVLRSLLREVDDPPLQQAIARLVGAAAAADRHLAESEVLLLAALSRHWGLDAHAAVAASAPAGLAAPMR